MDSPCIRGRKRTGNPGWLKKAGIALGRHHYSFPLRGQRAWTFARGRDAPVVRACVVRITGAAGICLRGAVPAGDLAGSITGRLPATAPPRGTSVQEGKWAINTGASAAPKVSKGENPATAAIALSAPTRFQSIGGPAVSLAVNCPSVCKTRA